MASRCLGVYCAMPRLLHRPLFAESQLGFARIAPRRTNFVCCALQESSTATGTVPAETEKKEVEEKPKRSPPAKAPVKALGEMMADDVIPALRTTLEAEEDISQIDLSFKDNRLEGSFLKKDIPYYFWAFFPDGGLTGPKGFSISSYGSGVSTVEPFLNDEKKITPRHIVFWVEKRLAAQGIIPVWKD
ncbi:DUF2996 family protein [Wolffia australiana]